MAPDMTQPRALIIKAIQRAKEDLINSLETGDRMYSFQDDKLREYQNCQRAADILGDPALKLDK